MRKFCKSHNGFTLVEIIVSIALLGIIAITFIPIFTISALVTSRTENTLESTYTGKDTMELMYNLSTNTNFENLEEELLSKGYIKDINDLFIYETTDNKYIELAFTDQGDLVQVVTKVYTDLNRTKIESKYESYYNWINKGDTGEG